MHATPFVIRSPSPFDALGMPVHNERLFRLYLSDGMWYTILTLRSYPYFVPGSRDDRTTRRPVHRARPRGDAVAACRPADRGDDRRSPPPARRPTADRARTRPPVRGESDGRTRGGVRADSEEPARSPSQRRDCRA